ncbi:hypothetical protein PAPPERLAPAPP_05300 [Brevundimonas phage vB_BpoS-Papperlapapp]|uniref:Uncharacterized protein n=2 Tax=Marchewkavirus TaxID=3425052 RepID=A0A9E7SJU1_9CAUD|nr:hypothetical protein KABACHOK_03670 [Brevundimonas phage vB_BpoS-Kabachok]USN14895.1 hypothetical protein DOMOVOI_04240 [Brevundimonas phage vB_BpoS-Domovoi]USN16268.1 hypothetical protein PAPPERLAPAPP_05300 [Brevundimonas phage vB_BpoS-Papperlapapp]
MSSTPTDDLFALRQYTLDLFDVGDDEEADVELIVNFPERPDIRKHVSLAGLYLLAVLTLDEEGLIADRMDELLASGSINEVDAANRIQHLLRREDEPLGA